MSVSVGSPGIRNALNRVEPFDPSWVVDLDISLTGDATAGTSTVTFTFGANEAIIPVYMSTLISANATVEMIWQVGTGVTINGVAQVIFGAELSPPVGVAGLNQHNVRLEKVAKTMIIPDRGNSPTMLTIADNIDGEIHRMSARAYVWPRDQILGLPCRLFWPYLL